MYNIVLKALQSYAEYKGYETMAELNMNAVFQCNKTRPIRTS
jgi:hypothetical protein